MSRRSVGPAEGTAGSNRARRHRDDADSSVRHPRTGAVSVKPATCDRGSSAIGRRVTCSKHGAVFGPHAAAIISRRAKIYQICRAVKPRERGPPGIAPSVRKAVELGGVLAGDLVDLVGGQLGEL